MWIDVIQAVIRSERQRCVSPSAFRPEYCVPRDTVEEAVRQRSMFNLVHRESVLKIDFVLRKHTRYRELEFDRRQRVQLGSAEVDVVRKEDLIISKIVWAEDSRLEVQKRDVRNLMATGYDKDYLEHWLKELIACRFCELTESRKFSGCHEMRRPRTTDGGPPINAENRPSAVRCPPSRRY